MAGNPSVWMEGPEEIVSNVLCKRREKKGERCAIVLGRDRLGQRPARKGMVPYCGNRAGATLKTGKSGERNQIATVELRNPAIGRLVNASRNTCL